MRGTAWATDGWALDKTFWTMRGCRLIMSSMMYGGDGRFGGIELDVNGTGGSILKFLDNYFLFLSRGDSVEGVCQVLQEVVAVLDANCGISA
jgi:hypothetical protein